jgi:hypothetical protein
VMQVEPEREEGGNSLELISESGQDREIRPEHVPVVSVPAGITDKGNTGISLAWEVDDAHLTADAGENQLSQGNDNSSLISEIDDVIGPDTGKRPSHKGTWFNTGLRQWFSDLKGKKK